MSKKTVALWMYRNEGGDLIQEKLKKKLEERNINVVNDFDMRECYCLNGRVYTKTGFDLSSVDILYHMNADEQTPYQNDILRALELSGVRIINSWNAFYTAKNKFMTNVLLKKNGINVPPSLFIDPKQAYEKAEEIFKDWKKICVKPTGRHGGKGIISFDNPEAFQDFIEATSDYVQSYYIEKFIEFDAHDYRIEIFNRKVVFGYCRARKHSFKTNIHSKGQFIREVPTADFEEIALKAAEILGIETTIVDMIRSKEDGMIYLLEVNPIMGAFVEAFIQFTEFRQDKTLLPSFPDKEKIDLIADYLSSFCNN